MKRARSEEDKNKRRQVLLDAALDAFSQYGYSATRMDEIAQRSQVSKGTLYLYFNSKEALFSALVDSIAVPQLNQLSNNASSLHDLLENLASITPVLIKHSKVPRLLKIIVGESHAFPELAKTYTEKIIDGLIQTLTEAVKRAIKEGEIQPVNADLLARLIISPIAYSMIWEVVFEPHAALSFDVKALIELHQNVLMQGVFNQEVNT